MPYNIRYSTNNQCTADIIIPHYLIPHFFRTTLSFGQNQFLFFPFFLTPTILFFLPCAFLFTFVNIYILQVRVATLS
jgi:hypothetical protein